MTETATVNWSLPPDLAQLGRLPVRQIGEDGQVRATGVSGRDMAVAPGRYFLACQLPNGRDIVRRKPIQVGAGQHLDPTFSFLEFELPLAGSAQAESPPATQKEPGLMAMIAHMFSRMRSASYVAAAGGHGRIVTGRWTALGDPAGPHVTDALPGPQRLIAGGGPQRIVRDPKAQRDLMIEVEAPGCRHFFILPGDAPIGAPAEAAIEVELIAAEDGLRPHFRSLVNAEANALFEYIGNGLLDAGLQLAADLLDRSEETLRAERASSLQAVLAGYILLRANAVENLEARAARLRLASWIPDVAVIEAEALARLGRHDEAVATLRTVLNGPCPWFRSGISYVLERLRLYLDVDSEESESFGLSAEDKPLFVEGRNNFEVMGRRLDTTSLFTAFICPTQLEVSAVAALTAHAETA